MAGCSYIAEFIAGATISGTRAASAMFESRSSARPSAIFAIALAVAGTIAIASAARASAMCGIVSGASQSEVSTGLRVSAANVSAPTKRSAPSVSTTSTSSPRCTSALHKAAAL